VIPESFVDCKGLRPVAGSIEERYPPACRCLVVRIQLRCAARGIYGAAEITFPFKTSGKLNGSLAGDASHARPFLPEPLLEGRPFCYVYARKQLAIVTRDCLGEAAGGEIVAHRSHISEDDLGCNTQLVVASRPDRILRQMPAKRV